MPELQTGRKINQNNFMGTEDMNHEFYSLANIADVRVAEGFQRLLQANIFTMVEENFEFICSKTLQKTEDFYKFVKDI